MYRLEDSRGGAFSICPFKFVFQESSPLNKTLKPIAMTSLMSLRKEKKFFKSEFYNIKNLIKQSNAIHEPIK